MRKIKKMTILLILALVLLGCYYLVNHMNEANQVSEEAGNFPLIERESDELTGIRWTKDDVEYNFVKEDDAWVNAEDENFPTSQGAVESLATRLMSMEANRMLEDVKSAGDYGITDDSFTVTAAWSDGSETIFSMGDETPFADGYYLSSSDVENTVYASASSLSSMFAETLVDLAELQEIPTVENPTHLQIGSALNISYSDADDRFDPDQYWYDSETGEPMDDVSVDEVISTFTSLGWQELLTASATEDDLAEWLLDDASATIITLSGDEGERTILIGTTDGNGDRYARLPESTMVYTISSDSADSLLNATSENMWNASPFAISYDNIQEIIVTLDGNDRSYLPLQKSEDEDGDEADADEAEAEETAETDEAAETDTVDETEAIWDLLSGLYATVRTDEVSLKDSLLKVRIINTEGIELSYDFHSYDVDNYLIEISDGRALLVSASEVDTLIRNLRQ